MKPVKRSSGRIFAGLLAAVMVLGTVSDGLTAYAAANDADTADLRYETMQDIDADGSVVAIADEIEMDISESGSVDLGLNPDSKTFFSNDEGQSTSDSNLSLAEFGIKEGSVLSIHQDAGVA